MSTNHASGRPTERYTWLRPTHESRSVQASEHSTDPRKNIDDGKIPPTYWPDGSAALRAAAVATRMDFRGFLDLSTCSPIIDIMSGYLKNAVPTPNGGPAANVAPPGLLIPFGPQSQQRAKPAKAATQSPITSHIKRRRCDLIGSSVDDFARIRCHDRTRARRLEPSAATSSCTTTTTRCSAVSATPLHAILRICLDTYMRVLTY
jgi:hypothetical protein